MLNIIKHSIQERVHHRGTWNNHRKDLLTPYPQLVLNNFNRSFNGNSNSLKVVLNI